jgi:hypothetical protein
VLDENEELLHEEDEEVDEELLLEEEEEDDEEEEELLLLLEAERLTLVADFAGEGVGDFRVKYVRAVNCSVFLSFLLLSPAFAAFNFVSRPSTAETVAVSFAPAFDFTTFSPKCFCSSSNSAAIVMSVISRLIVLRLLCHVVHSIPTLPLDGCFPRRNALWSSLA